MANSLIEREPWTNGSAEGTSKYIVGPIEQFDQKNEMFERVRWDPQLKEMKERVYGIRYPKDKDGYDHEDLALYEAAWSIDHAFGHGNITHTYNSGMYSWESMLKGRSQIPPNLKLKVTDTAAMSRNVKKVAKLFGASQAGICRLNRKWIYSHSWNRNTHEHSILDVPEEYKYAIVLVFEMDYELVKTSPKWLSRVTEGKGYSMEAFTTSMLAQFIRGLGYQAIPSGNDVALNIPLAIDAGLGELGRNGQLITPIYGPRVRISKVLTELPLLPDEPVEFGVVEFCEKCKYCARYCPSQAISKGGRTSEPLNISNASGALKWPINAEKCFDFWARNEGSCMNCIRTCPFNKPAGWVHGVVRWFVKNAPWTDAFTIRMDDLLGYGKQTKASKYWTK